MPPAQNFGTLKKATDCHRPEAEFIQSGFTKSKAEVQGNTCQKYTILLAKNSVFVLYWTMWVYIGSQLEYMR